MAARILIVEDSTLVTDAFTILFGETGYDVDVAATVAEAIELGTANPADIMLLDLTLPDGNGLEVLEALRERGASPRATLAMTGHDDARTRRACLDAGCAEVLLKPLPIGDLLRHIERHLS
ncbi:MAG: response regulator [Gemmatimonadota bacterium]|nr:response regulator [Gemmatimonadota bacterium]